MKILILLISALFLIAGADSYVVTVDAHNEECFFVKAESGTKLGLLFEIIDGGFLDIDVKITGPNQNVIYHGEKESSGKYTFAAPSPGIYTTCFNNEKSSMTPKVVMFSIDILETPKSAQSGAPKEEEIGHTKLEDMIRELSGTLTAVKHEQEYMHVRDKIHRSINESTNGRVVIWSVFEAVILVLMALGQIYYLKRFFEIKRVV